VAKYYAMCEWFDETCGELMMKLDEEGLRENTVILYICDNGWAAKSTNPSDWQGTVFKSYAMRSKASPYENGTRTPILVSWPSTIQPKKMSGFAHSIDLFPTIAAAAGLEAPEGLPGINLLDETAVNDRTCIFGSMNASHNISIGDPDATLQYLWCIEGDWKLLLRYHGKDTTHYRALHEWDTAPARLYNLKKDPAEKDDLAASHPELVARLKAKIEAWRPVGR
jgi:arylsulfatase A-like enzyme